MVSEACVMARSVAQIFRLSESRGKFHWQEIWARWSHFCIHLKQTQSLFCVESTLVLVVFYFISHQPAAIKNKKSKRWDHFTTPQRSNATVSYPIHLCLF